MNMYRDAWKQIIRPEWMEYTEEYDLPEEIIANE